MKAGPELDDRVAREVLGIVPCDRWRLVHHGGLSGPSYAMRSGCEVHGDGGCWPEQTWPPPLSQKIGGGWTVLERMADRWSVQLYRTHPSEPLDYTGVWVCKIGNIGRPADWGNESVGVADTAEEAICKAALEAAVRPT